MARRINTIVIPAAGQGTRLLPATRVTAKEMLPVYDTPMLQFALDEAAAAGAARVIIVISPDKSAIRDYVLAQDPHPFKPADISGLARSHAVEVVFACQQTAAGLGHAIACARALMLPGPFGVILPDDVIFGAPCLPEMARAYTTGHMVAAMDVPAAEACRYGMFRKLANAEGTSTASNRVAASGMVEKPQAGCEPSLLAAVGRYILDPSIFATLDRIRAGAGGEKQLTDAINADAERLPLTAFRFSGRRYDCGNFDGLLEAAMARQAQLGKLGKPAADAASIPATLGTRPKLVVSEPQRAQA